MFLKMCVIELNITIKSIYNFYTKHIWCCGSDSNEDKHTHKKKDKQKPMNNNDNKYSHNNENNSLNKTVKCVSKWYCLRTSVRRNAEFKVFKFHVKGQKEKERITKIENSFTWYN